MASSAPPSAVVDGVHGIHDGKPTTSATQLAQGTGLPEVRGLLGGSKSGVWIVRYAESARLIEGKMG